MTVYVLSDTHFMHPSMLRTRTRFSSVDEHDQFIVQNILETCGPRDTLYLLGDLAFRRDAMMYLELIAKSVEHLHIVLGNHDLERKYAPTLEDLVSVSSSISGMKRYKRAWLTHAPIHPSELYGKINIHGHIHGNTLGDHRYVNVCCEAVGYRPVSMADILGTGRPHQHAKKQ